MCEKELPKRDEFGIGQSLLVPSIFVLDTFYRAKVSQEALRCWDYTWVYLLMITHILVP